MNHFKVIGLFLTTIAILAIGLVALGSCSGNAGNTFAIPEFTEPGPPSIEVNIEQIYAEYMNDEAAANAKYEGKRLSFTNVEVEEIKIIIVDSTSPAIFIL